MHVPWDTISGEILQKHSRMLQSIVLGPLLPFQTVFTGYTAESNGTGECNFWCSWTLAEFECVNSHNYFAQPEMEPVLFLLEPVQGTSVACLFHTDYWHWHFTVLTESASTECTPKYEINCTHNSAIKQSVVTFCLSGAEAALFEAAGTASAAAGFRAREASASPREHWEPGNQA